MLLSMLQSFLSLHRLLTFMETPCFSAWRTKFVFPLLLPCCADFLYPFSAADHERVLITLDRLDLGRSVATGSGEYWCKPYSNSHTAYLEI